jgi:SAM-dependent methyltransferase
MSNTSSSQSQAVDAKKLLDMNYAFAQTALLVAAVRLHLFTILHDKTMQVTELAKLVHIEPERLHRLLRGLCRLQLLEQENEYYRLTPLAECFLVEGKATYLGGDTLAMLDYLPAWFQLDQTLQTGKPYRDLGDPTTAEEFFASRVRDLFPLVYPIALRTASELKLPQTKDDHVQILDVGAGSAPWSAAFARIYPLSHVTALDLSAVVEQGRQQTLALELQDRYTWIAEDMDTYEYPVLQYDLIIVGHVLRFIGDERGQQLVRKLALSLRPHGTLIVADVFMHDDHQGPPPAITLDISMLVNTQQGKIRCWREVGNWLSDCGLQYIQSFHVAGPFPIVFAQKG